MKKNILYTVLLLLVVFAVPQILSDFGTNLTTEIFIMAMFAMSLGLIMGYAGLDSLGHAAFFGIGAYSVALIGKFVTNTYLIIIIAVAIAGLIAFITGAVFIRTSKFYFLMITLAFSQLIFTLLWQMKDLTGGADGMSVSAIMNLGFGDIFDPQTMYYVMGIIFVAVFILLRLFVESPAGKITKGVMENEGRMAALGYDVRVYKLLAFTLSGALAGFAGSLYSFYNVFVSPELSAWLFSGQVMIMVIVGGVGTLLGPAIGAGVFIFLQNFISTYTERWPLILGAILIFLVLIGKGGIIQWLKLGVTMIFKSKPKNNKVSSTIQAEKEEVIN